MANEAALNMEFFNENINGTKNINSEYIRTIAKEDHIITGECYLNYLFSNDLMKPFIKKNYLWKDEKKTSYFDKLNIFNYKGIFNDVLNKKKKNFITPENEAVKRILKILDTNYESNNNHFKHKNIKNINKYSTYLRNININQAQAHNQNMNRNETNYYNNNNLHSSFDQYILPKINIVKNRKGKKNSEEKIRNSFELSNDIFRTSSYTKSINNDSKISLYNDQNDRYKKISFYSPLLKKNIQHIFRRVEDRENQSVKKSRYIQDGIGKITKTKFNINSYDFVKNKYKIKHKKPDDKKYCLINLFTDIGKIKSPQEIEKTLFNKDEYITFSKLKANLEKKGIRRINKNLELNLDS